MANSPVVSKTISRADQSSEREPLAVSVTEAAVLLGISRALAYELVARGDLPSLRLGRRVVVPRQALVALVEDPEWVHRDGTH